MLPGCPLGRAQGHHGGFWCVVFPSGCDPVWEVGAVHPHAGVAVCMPMSTHVCAHVCTHVLYLCVHLHPGGCTHAPAHMPMCTTLGAQSFPGVHLCMHRVANGFTNVPDPPHGCTCVPSPCHGWTIFLRFPNPLHRCPHECPVLPMVAHSSPWMHPRVHHPLYPSVGAVGGECQAASVLG